MLTLEQLNARGKGYLPGLIGIEILRLEPGWRREHKQYIRDFNRCLNTQDNQSAKIFSPQVVKVRRSWQMQRMTYKFKARTYLLGAPYLGLLFGKFIQHLINFCDYCLECFGRTVALHNAGQK